jgi:predicted transcriptional regulator
LCAANLSYARVVRYLEEMKALEVVKETEKAYSVTQKGVEFMNNFEKLEEFTESFGFKV